MKCEKCSKEINDQLEIFLVESPYWKMRVCYGCLPEVQMQADMERGDEE